LRCKITHTQITVIIDTSEQGYNATISSWRDMQNHTHRLQSSLIHQNKVTMRPYLHDEIWKITQTHTSILLVGRSCSHVIDLAARGHWTSSIFVDGLENWFLACNGTTKLPKPALLVCKSIPRVDGERIGKIMITRHWMKDCSSWK
jgi:hypothetical protein